MKGAMLIASAIVAIPLLAASAAWGQGRSQPASNQDSGVNSDHSNRAFEQTSNDRDGSIEQQVKDLHEQRRMAALKGDASFLEKYLADDYLGSGDDGRLITKDQEVQMLRSGAVKYEAIDERDVKVRVYGDAAIVSTLTSVKLLVDGKPVTCDQRATFVWAKQERNWKLVSFQATRVVPMVPRPGNNLGHDARPGPP